MSFVDLMASDVWSEADIARRTEAMVRSEFSADAELILNRKLQGVVLGQYKLSAVEQVEVARFERVLFEAKLAGEEARADMALLRNVLAIEPAFLRLRRPAVEPVLNEQGQIQNQAELDQDATERADAQALVDAASEDVMKLVMLRNPEPELENLAVEDADL